MKITVWSHIEVKYIPQVDEYVYSDWFKAYKWRPF